MLRSENVATPFTAVTVLVPDSVPGATKPPLCPMAIVTWPLKLETRLPRASSTVTCTAGWIARSGSALLGWTVKAKCGGGFRASVVASHVPPLWPKNQVQRGSVVPPPGKRRYAAFSLSPKASDPASNAAYPSAPGPSRPHSPDSVAVYATPPAPTVMGPAWATAIVVSEPDAERCAPSAIDALSSTPFHAEILMPPSATGSLR